MYLSPQLQILQPFFSRSWPIYLFGVGMLILVDILQLFIPHLIGNAVDSFISTGPAWNSPLGWLAAIAVVIAFSRYLYRVSIMGTTRRLEFYLRQLLFSHALRLPLPYFDEHGPGSLMALMTNDITAVRMAVGLGIMLFVDAVIMGAASAVVMALSINKALAWQALAPLPIVLLSAATMGQSVHMRFRAVQDKFSDLTEFSQEIFAGARVIKGFAAEGIAISRFAALSEENVQTNMRMARTQATFLPLTHIVPLFCYAITLYEGGRLIMDGILSIGDFAAFTGYLGLIIWPVMGIGYLINTVQRGLASLGRIADLLAKPQYEQESAEHGLTTNNMNSPSIIIKHLKFSYPTAILPTLQDVCIEIPAGATVGIVGRTGSGKSTLLKLLLRLYDPPQNAVFINDQEIHSIDYNYLRTSIGYVPQDSLLFSSTIGENIAFDKEYSGEQIREAAASAVISETIVTRTEGFDTVLGEKGRRLSGGQQQRVAIARALIKQPKLLLLDDIFAALDYRTQVELLQNMREFIAGRTALIVSQRVAAVKDVDFIMVMENGTIVEQGRHQELINRRGAYYSLYEQQLIDGEL